MAKQVSAQVAARNEAADASAAADRAYATAWCKAQRDIVDARNALVRAGLAEEAFSAANALDSEFDAAMESGDFDALFAAVQPKVSADAFTFDGETLADLREDADAAREVLAWTDGVLASYKAEAEAAEERLGAAQEVILNDRARRYRKFIMAEDY